MQKQPLDDGHRFFDHGILIDVFENSNYEFEFTIYNATSINDPEPVEIDGGSYSNYISCADVAFDLFDEYKAHRLF